MGVAVVAGHLGRVVVLALLAAALDLLVAGDLLAGVGPLVAAAPVVGGVAHFAVVAVLVVDPVQTVFCLVGRHGHAVVPGVVLSHVQRALLTVAPGHTGAVLRLPAAAVVVHVAVDAVLACAVRAAVHVLRLFHALLVLHDPALVAAAALAGRVVARAVIGPDHLFDAAALGVGYLALDAVLAPALFVRGPRVGVGG